MKEKKCIYHKKDSHRVLLTGQLVRMAEKRNKKQMTFQPLSTPENAGLCVFSSSPEAHSTPSKGNKMTKVPFGATKLSFS